MITAVNRNIRPTVAEFNPDIQPISLGGWLWSEEAGSTPQYALDLFVVFVRSREAVISYTAESGRIRLDGNLSQQGKLQKIGALAQEKIKIFPSLRAKIAAAESDIATIQRDLLPAPPKSADMRSVLRESELRRFYMRMNDQERLDGLQRALRDGDAEFLGAIVNAPGALRLLSDGMRTAILQELAKQKDPGATTKITDLVAAVRSARYARGQALSYICGDAGIANPDDES